MIEWDVERFKRMFPNLYREMFNTPTILDHFEVCKDEREALEIIDYFEKKGELTKDDAEYLRKNMERFKRLFGLRKRGDFSRRGLVD
jgi:hypothetical protein